MARLRYGQGSVTIEMDDTLERLYRNAMERLAPGLVPRIEQATEGVFTAAYNAWPVKSGQSRAGLQQSVTVSPDGTIRGRVVNDVSYARFIKPRSLNGKSAFVELLRKPAQAAASDLVRGLTEDTKKILRGEG